MVLTVSRSCGECARRGLACEPNKDPAKACAGCRRAKVRCDRGEAAGTPRAKSKRPAASISNAKTKEDLETAEGYTVIEHVEMVRAEVAELRVVVTRLFAKLATLEEAVRNIPARVVERLEEEEQD